MQKQLEAEAQNRAGQQQELQAQTAQQAWERPWQEKLWQYQLNQPYFKPTAGGGNDDPLGLF